MTLNILMAISLLHVGEGVKDTDYSQLIYGIVSLIILLILKYKEEYTND